jgi:hypothetical protein
VPYNKFWFGASGGPGVGGFLGLNVNVIDVDVAHFHLSIFGQKLF